MNIFSYLITTLEIQLLDKISSNLKSFWALSIWQSLDSQKKKEKKDNHPIDTGMATLMIVYNNNNNNNNNNKEIKLGDKNWKESNIQINLGICRISVSILNVIYMREGKIHKHYICLKYHISNGSLSIFI